MNTWKNIARIILPRSFRLSILCPNYIRQRVISKTRMRVASGPFAGMQYLDEAVGSVLEPKLIGIYEKELHEVVEQLVERGPTTIIDIGAAEGYYAVGLALRLTHAKIFAFETETKGQKLLAQLAKKNGVNDRIQILGACDVSELNRVIANGLETTIVCDVEGAESFLLDPAQITALKKSSILVELHPKQCPGVKEIIKSRFASSHDIKVIVQEPRIASDFPYQSFPVKLFPNAYLENAVSEFRQPWEEIMNWYWMVPK
jgi:hypothetical protein